MKIIKAKTIDGKTVDRFLPENQEDIDELILRNEKNEVDTRESFSDFPDRY